MAGVVLTPSALQDLERLLETHSLPADTRRRLSGSLRALAEFPLIGSPLHGRWSDFRFVLGPWRWMIIVYVYDQRTDSEAVVTIQDARSARAATGQG